MAEPGKKTKQRVPRLGKGLSSLMSRPVAVEPESVVTPQISSATPKPVEAGDIDAARQVAGAVEDIGEQGPKAEVAAADTTDGLVYLALSDIEANPNQPRKAFNEQTLQQLADSIKSAGLMQPIVVHKITDSSGKTDRAGGGKYQVVAGERRWRAAKIAGLKKLPVLIRQLDEQQVAEWALIENLQREDLNPIERAAAFASLIEQFDMSHEMIAKSVGIERPTVSNSLRLLSLCDSVQQLIIDGHLSAGQGRALAAIEDVEQQMALAKQAANQAWSVRKVEQAVRKFNKDGGAGASGGGGAKNSASGKPAHLGDLEKQLGDQLQTRVRIRPGRKKGSGTLTIDFYSLDQFDDLLARLKVSAH